MWSAKSLKEMYLAHIVFVLNGSVLRNDGKYHLGEPGLAGDLVRWETQHVGMPSGMAMGMGLLTVGQPTFFTSHRNFTTQITFFFK